jgi:putative endonuclease
MDHTKVMIDKPDPTENLQTWKVYILLSSDNKLYTGITNNMVKRWQKHCAKKGAKFFYGRKPVALCYLENGHDRSSAGKREYQIKALTRDQKWQLIIENFGPHLLPKLK